MCDKSHNGLPVDVSAPYTMQVINPHWTLDWILWCYRSCLYPKSTENTFNGCDGLRQPVITSHTSSTTHIVEKLRSSSFFLFSSRFSSLFPPGSSRSSLRHVRSQVKITQHARPLAPGVTWLGPSTPMTPCCSLHLWQRHIRRGRGSGDGGGGCQVSRGVATRRKSAQVRLKTQGEGGESNSRDTASKAPKVCVL